jgi:hypothetical protein
MWIRLSPVKLRLSHPFNLLLSLSSVLPRNLLRNRASEGEKIGIPARSLARRLLKATRRVDPTLVGLPQALVTRFHLPLMARSLPFRANAFQESVSLGRHFRQFALGIHGDPEQHQARMGPIGKSAPISTVRCARAKAS